MKRIRGFKKLVFDGIDETTRLVERTHHRVTERTIRRFAPVEPLSTPARTVAAVQTATASAVYATVRLVSRAVQKATDVGEEMLVPESIQDEDHFIAHTEMRSDAIGSLSWVVDHAESALNGFVGDYLNRTGNALDLKMTLRHRAQVIPVDRETLARELPNATSKVCIFVHGLGCTEWAWSIAADRFYGDPTVNFGTQLSRDLGYTPLYVRYNTGRHVSENGRSLSQLIADVVAAYPVAVTEIALVGHSMGGLVCRSAAHYGKQEEQPWIEALRHVFCLGSPHVGARLEQGAHWLSVILAKLDAAGADVPAEILNMRSSGVKDLRFGYTLDEEWQTECADPFADNRQNVPCLDGVGYYSLGATIFRDLEHPLGQWIGDLLVHPPSASGIHPDSSRCIPFRSGRVFTGMHHFHLGNHPDVYAVIRSALAGECDTMGG